MGNTAGVIICLLQSLFHIGMHHFIVCVVIRKTKLSFVGPTRLNSAPMFVQVGGRRVAAMLSLDEPLDLKVPRRANGRDRGAHSPPLFPLHPKRARQLRMADDGTAVIEPASPASPHTGGYGNNKHKTKSLQP